MYVLTGGPTNGKSTLLKKLKDFGHLVLEETAREVLEERRNFVVNDAERLIREQEIFRRQIKREAEAIIKNKDRHFLDRSLIDVIAYSDYHLGYIPDEFKSIDLKNRYNNVFFLERLPFIPDGTRIEKDDNEAERIHRKLIDTYCEMGYNLISVPVFPVDKINDRIDFILSYINKIEQSGV